MNTTKRHRTRKSPQKTRKSRSRQETIAILPTNTIDRKLNIGQELIEKYKKLIINLEKAIHG